MKQIFLLATLLSFSLGISAQSFFDDFTDGDFTNNPTWFGDTGEFIINPSNQLQLNDTISNTSIIYATAPTSGNTVWDFYIKMDFAPSTSNLTKIYLSADDTDFTTGNGYYLLFGESGSDDLIRLFRQDNGSSTELLAGTTNIGAAFEVWVKITRSANNEWRLFADFANGGTNLVQEGPAIIDDTHQALPYIGFYCKYTSSRAQDFYFDSVQVSPLFVDAVPPVLVSATPTSSTTLDVLFNESLKLTSANTASNYSVSDIGTATSASLDGTNPKLVHLTFATPFQNATTHTLTTQNVEDDAGNPSITATTDFIFYTPDASTRYDIVINEIFADPTPSIGLPEGEYIELYNRSDKVINLLDFELMDGGSSPIFLPEFILEPDSYVILYDDAPNVYYGSYGDTMRLSNFPSLTNGGEQISLTNPNGDIIDIVNFTDKWYQDSDKDEGGWSLERINPNKPCEGSSNWRASVALAQGGGTPGQVNSVLETGADTDGPALLNVVPLSTTELQLFFDETLDETAVSNTANYSIPNVTVSNASLNPDNFTVVTLDLSTVLSTSTIYEISFNAGLTDCIGNAISTNTTAQFAIPETALIGDVIINEVLFNPQTGGTDFVELYNNSDKVLNVGDLMLANLNDLNEVSSLKPVESDYLLFPNEYVVLTEDAEDIKARYTVENLNAFVTTDLPTYPDDEGTVILIYQGLLNSELDRLTYNKDWHYDLLDAADGVSLERISPAAPTQDQNNWHSAAATVGFATPTSLNSQNYTTLAPDGTEMISLTDKVFSPDGDSYEDLLFINYSVDQQGYTCNINLYDAKGRLVRRLVENELLGAESGSFKWDGTTDEGTKAPLGIYVIHSELFDLDGDIIRLKTTCVVAGKL